VVERNTSTILRYIQYLSFIIAKAFSILEGTVYIVIKIVRIVPGHGPEGEKMEKSREVCM